MNLKGDQDFISVHEWAARLCHIMLVEAGYFPCGDNLVNPQTAIEMSDNVRIPE